MLVNELIEKTQGKNGRYLKMEYVTHIQPLKAYKGSTIEKVVEGVFRLGLFYGAVIGQPNEVEGTNGVFGEWYKGQENKIYEKIKDGEKVHYVRLFTTKNSKHKSKVKYLLNGIEVSKEYLLENGYVSEAKLKSSSSELVTFVKKIEDIIKIG